MKKKLISKYKVFLFWKTIKKLLTKYLKQYTFKPLSLNIGFYAFFVIILLIKYNTFIVFYKKSKLVEVALKKQQNLKKLHAIIFKKKN